MSDALLIFTIAGVQRFIGEARRLSDLVAGSRLVARLAGVAARGVQDAGGTLLFPPVVSDRMPNRIVARVDGRRIPVVADAARRALDAEFRGQADKARATLARTGPAPDRVWEEIWERQLASQWETFWAAAPLSGGDYGDAYRDASRALDGCKRTRAFPQAVEEGWKDSLSGSRAALHTGDSGDARGYWARVGANYPPSRLKPEGKERLDAMGALKRFGSLAERVPSVSSVASADFLAAARGSPGLERYRDAVQRLLGSSLYRVSEDPEWPYDGDLFYRETLEPSRLRDSHGINRIDQQLRAEALDALLALHKETGGPPSPYYALLMLDGDRMGERISGCRTEEEHRRLSSRVAAFASGAGDLLKSDGRWGQPVYAGGDDVLALLPLRTATAAALDLAEAFANSTGGTASAGLALVHHLYPLDAALATAHRAEEAAKEVEGKDAVGVRVVKRSGEVVELRSPRAPLQASWGRLCDWFARETLSSRFAQEVAVSAGPLAANQEGFGAELRRLIRRHRARGSREPADGFAEELAGWSASLPERARGLAGWLQLARFVAKGGEE